MRRSADRLTAAKSPAGTVLASAAVAAVAAAALLSGCGSSGNGQPGGSPAAPSSPPTASSSPSTGPSSATAPAPTPAKALLLSTADNGRQVHVSPGTPIVLTLDSTYWHLAPVSSPALRGRGVSVHARRGGIPGTGRGKVVANYVAASPGRAVIAADRTVCGEAMACSPGQQHFRVTIVVG